MGDKVKMLTSWMKLPTRFRYASAILSLFSVQGNKKCQGKFFNFQMISSRLGQWSQCHSKINHGGSQSKIKRDVMQ